MSLPHNLWWFSSASLGHYLPETKTTKYKSKTQSETMVTKNHALGTEKCQVRVHRSGKTKSPSFFMKS